MLLERSKAIEKEIIIKIIISNVSRVSHLSIPIPDESKSTKVGRNKYK
jgi:hypothetical protein